MSKQMRFFIPILAIIVVLILGYEGFGWKEKIENTEIASAIELFSSFNDVSSAEKREAWQVFQNYLEFARAHDLDGVRMLSHQLSATCNDPTREAECFALMDSVYAFGSFLKLSDFEYIESDSRQTIMYTKDGPMVAVLYFTRNDEGTLKILGLRFCYEEDSSRCVNTDPLTRDLDNDGWWDEVESLFY